MSSHSVPSDTLEEPILAELVDFSHADEDSLVVAEGSVATLAPPQLPLEDEASDDSEGTPVEGPLCEKCGAGPVDLETWCRQCGYYPRLGSCIDIEAEREIEGFKATAYTEPVPFWKLVPAWAWKLAAALVGVIAFSIVGRLITPAQSGPRALWAFAQFLVAFLVFAAAHVWAFVKASMIDSRLGGMDMLTKPLAIWGPTIGELPESERRLILGSGGFTGLLCAFLVVGGMDYDRLFDWGIEPPPPKKSKGLSGANAGGGGSEDDGPTVNDVGSGSGAGTEEEDTGTGKTDADAGGAESKEDKLRPKKIDCVVIGYLPNEKSPEKFDALVLAANVRGRLRAVGIVRRGVPDEMRAEITSRFSELRCPRPIVPCHLPKAIWLKDGVRCRVRFAKWVQRKTIRNVRFDALLVDES
ncbi:MAG: hypothetical protein IID44_27840 [Planctomycetes bacterium]|nr:hypothetical protein [Planctomycetota bacterium]